MTTAAGEHLDLSIEEAVERPCFGRTLMYQPHIGGAFPARPSRPGPTTCTPLRRRVTKLPARAKTLPSRLQRRVHASAHGRLPGRGGASSDGLRDQRRSPRTLRCPSVAAFIAYLRDRPTRQA